MMMVSVIMGASVWVHVDEDTHRVSNDMRVSDGIMVNV